MLVIPSSPRFFLLSAHDLHRQLLTDDVTMRYLLLLPLTLATFDNRVSKHPRQDGV